MVDVPSTPAFIKLPQDGERPARPRQFSLTMAARRSRHTMVATATIVGTTVFIVASDVGLKIFSWEGEEARTTTDGQCKSLRSGERLVYWNCTWAKLPGG